MAFAVLGAGMAALVVPPALVLVTLAVVVGLGLADFALARRPVAIETELATVLARGIAQPLTIRVQATDRDRRSGLIEIRQAVCADVELDRSRHRFDPDDPDAGVVLQVTAHRRGRHELPPLAVRRTGPLGLAAVTGSATAGHRFEVHPDLPAALRLAHAVRTGQFSDEGPARRRALGLGTDFESIRDYQPDDDIRLVNWPATTRSGRPMSNQYRDDQDREVVCAIDTGRLMTSPVGDRTRLDAALDAVAAVAAVADVVGDRVGALAFSDRVHQEITTRRHGGWSLLRTLFDLEPRPVESDYERAFHRIAGAKRSLILVFTDLLDEAAASSLLAATPVLARRHAVLIVSASDPGETELLEQEPGSVRDVLTASVVAGLLETRTRVVHELRSRGATVVDAPPEALSRACVAAYLGLKSRSRL